MTAEKKKPEQTDSIAIEDAPNVKIADFETAISAAGNGKFQYFLILAIIPASWASSVDTANMSMILASAESDLGLSLFNKGLLNAIIYVGMVMSGFVWGYLADVKGRKKVILYGYFADGVCNVLAGLSQNFGTLVFFKFLSGLLVSGPHATLMAYCTEFYGDKSRAKIPILVGFSVQFGCVINAVLAWLVVPRPWSIVLWDGAFVYNSWRIFLSLCGVPTMIGVLCLSFFPESPKFLMTQNRNEDALEVLKQIYSTNTGLPKDNYPIRALGDMNLNHVIPERSLDSREGAKSSFKDGIRQMMPILSKPHLARILLLVTVQFGGMLSLNTLRLWQPQLFAMIENFQGLAINVTDPTFCEMLDISTSLDATAAPPSVPENESTMYTGTIVVSITASAFILLASVLVHFIEHNDQLQLRARVPGVSDLGHQHVDHPRAHVPVRRTAERDFQRRGGRDRSALPHIPESHGGQHGNDGGKAGIHDRQSRVSGPARVRLRGADHQPGVLHSTVHPSHVLPAEHEKARGVRCVTVAFSAEHRRTRFGGGGREGGR